MKYIYNGIYREFRGYVFTEGKPVEITDRGTLELIKHEPDFKECHDEEIEERQDPTEAVLHEISTSVINEEFATPHSVTKDLMQHSTKPKFNRSEWMKKMHAEGRMRKK